MFKVTDVVKNLLIINILIFFGSLLLGEPTVRGGEIVSLGRGQFALFYPGSPNFAPYQIVTHMFMHGSLTHLFFNMFVLYMFGPPIEALWGAKRFLFFYLFAGFGSVVLDLTVKYIQLHYFGDSEVLYSSSWGASGAIYGVLVAFAMNFPDRELLLLIPPIPMKAKYFILLFVGIDLFLGLTNMQTGIAHFAHLGGALSAALLILYWRKYGTKL